MTAAWRQGILMAGICMLVVIACKSDAEPEKAGDTVLRIGNETVSLADAQAEIDAMPPPLRNSFNTAEDRRQYVKKWINKEILLREAQRLGYERDPEVRAAMERAMVLKVLKERIGTEPPPGEVTEGAIRAYYEAHRRDFTRPEEAQVTQIVVRDERRAVAILDEAHQVQVQLPPDPGVDAAAADLEAFRALVFKYSEDPEARQNGGDLAVTHGPEQAKDTALVDAAMRLHTVGELSPIVRTKDGFHIVKLRKRISEKTTSLEEARPRVVRRLTEQMRDLKVDGLVADLSKTKTVEVFEEQLDRLRFD